MPDAFWLAAALLSAVLGMGWLALALDVHWRQVHATARRTPREARALRLLGSLGLTTSLACCLLADTATMAVLVWMMLLAVAAFGIALLLGCHPRLLVWTWRGARRP